MAKLQAPDAKELRVVWNLELGDSLGFGIWELGFRRSRADPRVAMNFTVPTGLEAEIDELITHYPQKRSAALMVLHAVQGRLGWISREAIEWIARKLELQPIHIYELVTFYPMYRQQPVGKYQIKICRTLSCALGGSCRLHEHFCGKLGLDPRALGVQTTRDGKFSIEFVESLASCGTAPVMMCNDEFYEGVTEARADE